MPQQAIVALLGRKRWKQQKSAKKGRISIARVSTYRLTISRCLNAFDLTTRYCMVTILRKRSGRRGGASCFILGFRQIKTPWIQIQTLSPELRQHAKLLQKVS